MYVHLTFREGLYTLSEIYNNGVYEVRTKRKQFTVSYKQIKCIKPDERYHKPGHRDFEMFVKFILSAPDANQAIADYAEHQIDHFYRKCDPMYQPLLKGKKDLFIQDMILNISRNILSYIQTTEDSQPDEEISLSFELKPMNPFHEFDWPPANTDYSEMDDDDLPF